MDKLDAFPTLNEQETLTHAGHISAAMSKLTASFFENGKFFRLAKKCPYSYNVATFEKRLFGEPVAMKSGLIDEAFIG